VQGRRLVVVGKGAAAFAGCSGCVGPSLGAGERADPPTAGWNCPATYFMCLLTSFVISNIET
jgi:hypothetical protein